MANLFDLANRMELRAKNLPLQVTEVKRRTALFLVEALVWATPVDTSQALSNWTLSIGQPATAFIRAHNEGFYGSTRMSSGAEAIALANSVAKSARMGLSIWVSNNTPYIIDLNFGTSRQAPAMFVEYQIYRTRKEVARIAKEVFNDRKYRH